MTAEHQPILDALHEQVAREATEKIKRYIGLTAFHVCAGGLTGEDETNEGKNG